MAKRLCSTLSDEELRNMCKVHFPHHPLRSLDLVREANYNQVASQYEAFFMSLAEKKTRLNKMQLVVALSSLFKGKKSEIEEFAGKLATSYAEILKKSRWMKDGSKLDGAVASIAKTYGNVDSSPDVGGKSSMPDSSPELDAVQEARARYGLASPSMPTRALFRQDSAISIASSPEKVADTSIKVAFPPSMVGILLSRRSVPLS